MSLIDLRDSLLVPFVLLLFCGGLYLTIKLRFFQFPYYFLGLKLLAGSLDWKAGKGKLAPADAIAAGSAFHILPGAVLGAGLALATAGPGVLLWIWITTLLLMPYDFVAGILSHRTRMKDTPRNPRCGPAWFLAHVGRLRWMAYLFALLFLFTALAMGGSLPVAILEQTQARAFGVHPVTVSVLLMMVLVFVIAGGVRRIGILSKHLLGLGFYALVLALVLIGYWLFKNTAELGLDVNAWHFLLATFSRAIGDSREDWMRLLSGLGIYWAIAGTGSGKLSTLAGAIRTNYAAKAGLASIPPALFASLFTATVTAYLLFSFQGMTGAGHSPMEIFFDFSRGPGLAAIIALVLAALFTIVAGMAGWSFAGFQAATFLGGRIGGTLYQIVFLVVVGGTGVLLHLRPGSGPDILQLAIIACIGASFFSIAGTMIQSNSAALEWRRYRETDELQSVLARDLVLLFLHVLPNNTVSRLFGYFSMIRFPRFIMLPLLRWFAGTYRINVDEAQGELRDYKSLNLFFTRPLRDGVRPVDQRERGVVSPVDGMLSRMGPINEGLMIQAKGMLYSVRDLLEGSEHLDLFEGGQYCVIYLSPQDYHRIHTPVEGEVLSYTYAPGRLFPVNMLAVNGLHGLFPKNERLTSFIQSPYGMVAVVKVGATNVGRIRVTYDRISTNRWLRLWKNHMYNRPPILARGAELGRFEMGSTVILVFERGTFRFRDGLTDNTRVRYGEHIGDFVTEKALSIDATP